MIRIPINSGPTKRCHRNTGFTIVELLVAASITLVLLGLMVQVTLSMLKTFDKVTGSLTTKTQATTALDYIRRDFQSIVWRRDNNVWMLATIQPDQTTISGKGDTDIGDADWIPPGIPKPGNVNPGEDYSSLRLEDPSVANGVIDLDQYRFGQAGVWLRFFTNQISSNTPNAGPLAVSYQIVRMPPRGSSTEVRYLFFRSVVESGPQSPGDFSVLSAGYDLTSSAANGYNQNNAAGTVGLPQSVRKPDRQVILANNVVDFGVRFWQRDAATGALNLVFPATAAAKPSNGKLGFAATALAVGDLCGGAGAGGIPFGSLTNAKVNLGYPDFVDVVLRVLTDEGARIIEAYETGKSIAPPNPSGSGLSLPQWRQAYWWTLALEHSQVFVERIPITSRPL